MDGEAEKWDWRRSPGGAMGSRADRVDGKSVCSHSHGAALHGSASLVPLPSSLCSNITFIKMFWGVLIYSHHLLGCTYQKQTGLLGMITNLSCDT